MQATAKRVEEVVENIKELSAQFAQQRAERHRRRALDKADFDALTDAGFHLTGAPPEMGGINGGVTEFTRPLCEMLRILAKGDPSVSLVASMHPAVIGGWLEVTEAPPPYTDAWEKQRRTVFETALEGCWWGTIISEPGSGGDPSKSRAVAKPRPSDGKYLISGQKHFGSGSGMTSFMITQAVPEGESCTGCVLHGYARCTLGRHCRSGACAGMGRARYDRHTKSRDELQRYASHTRSMARQSGAAARARNCGSTGRASIYFRNCRCRGRGSRECSQASSSQEGLNATF